MRAIVVAFVVAACGGPAVPAAPLENRSTAVPVPAGPPGISGRLLDEVTHEPLASAVVIVMGTDIPNELTAFTDEDGRYHVDVTPGRRIVTFYFGDRAVQRIVIVPASGTFSLEVSMPAGQTQP